MKRGRNHKVVQFDPCIAVFLIVSADAVEFVEALGILYDIVEL